MQDYKGALSDFRKAIELKPDYVEAYISKGNTEATLLDFKNALDDLTKALSMQLGDARFNLHEYKEAVDQYTKALALEPKNKATVLHNRGHAKLFMQDYEGALEDYSASI